jgi:hypothetical protein
MNLSTEFMQRDIRQENRMNTLTVSEGQKMYLKFFKNIKTVEFELLFILNVDSNLNKNFAIFIIHSGNIFLYT